MSSEGIEGGALRAALHERLTTQGEAVVETSTGAACSPGLQLTNSRPALAF